MTLPAAVARFLEDNSVEHTLVAKANLNAEAIAKKNSAILRGVLLKANKVEFLAVVQNDFLFDYEVVKDLLDCEPAIIAREDAQVIFSQCDKGCWALIPTLFRLQGIVDSSIEQLDSVYLDSGNKNFYIHVQQSEFEKLFSGSQKQTIACGPEKLYSGSNKNNIEEAHLNEFTPIRIKQRIDETFDLPAMPDIAQDIMKLRVDPSADAAKLGAIVAKDPSLSAQIISWASSPYYGYKGTIDSIETAISRVLGFDLVMNLALGISIGKALKVPTAGPLGLTKFWQQAIYSASLVEKLCQLIPIKQRPERGLAYLSGLLHNFGHLLLGHLFPPQFQMINRFIETNPNIQIEDIEHFVLGVTHQEIGAWLMKNWHMPDELIVAVRWHHQEEFWSKHAVYSNLVLLAGRLLKRIEVGDSHLVALPASTLELLHLEEDKIEEVFERLLDERVSLDAISKQLVA